MRARIALCIALAAPARRGARTGVRGGPRSALRERRRMDAAPPTPDGPTRQLSRSTTGVASGATGDGDDVRKTRREPRGRRCPRRTPMRRRRRPLRPTARLRPQTGCPNHPPAGFTCCGAVACKGTAAAVRLRPVRVLRLRGVLLPLDHPLAAGAVRPDLLSAVPRCTLVAQRQWQKPSMQTAAELAHDWPSVGLHCVPRFVADPHT